jgi:hypothetical protein
MTNIRGETLAIAIEGPHNDADNVVFVPEWVFERLGIINGEEVIMDPILEPLPQGETVTIRPMNGSSVEGPVFLEGLTEALSQLGVVQEGLLYAQVDPSMPQLHGFMIESLTPLSVCLADGELRVNLERALDRPLTPEPEIYEIEPDEEIFEGPMDGLMDEPMVEPIETPPLKGKFTAFSGKGYKLG